MHLNVEIKAICKNAEAVRNFLMEHNAGFKGTDNQTDTYFMVKNGRLKLRQGNIENSLIHYARSNQAGPKESEVNMIQIQNSDGLKSVLEHACGILVEVKKEREIYFIENVKFHLDRVPGLGEFIEIEAIDHHGDIGREKLLEQCNNYMRQLGIAGEDLQTTSYSDMLLARKKEG